MVTGPGEGSDGPRRGVGRASARGRTGLGEGEARMGWSWGWWVTTVGGAVVLGLTQAAEGLGEPERSVLLGIAGALGFVLGLTHPGPLPVVGSGPRRG